MLYILPSSIPENEKKEIIYTYSGRESVRGSGGMSMRFLRKSGRGSVARFGVALGIGPEGNGALRKTK